jgi:hypothetical protein
LLFSEKIREVLMDDTQGQAAATSDPIAASNPHVVQEPAVQAPTEGQELEAEMGRIFAKLGLYAEHAATFVKYIESVVEMKIKSLSDDSKKK